MKSYDKQFINGEWIEGGSEHQLQNLNPYNDDVLYVYKGASKEDVDRAFIAAQNAQKEWWQLTPREKNNLLEKLIQILILKKEELYTLLAEESGSVRRKSDAEFYGSIDHIKMSMSFPYMMDGKIIRSNVVGKVNYIFKKPKGVVGVIAPWNFPFLLAIRSVVPAIATGNSVVLKPSSDTPGSAFILAEMFEEAGFPKGLFNVVAGASSEIGDYFVSHPIPNIISFTGSTEVGRRIGEITGKTLKDVALELGGNNVMAILHDADLKKAAHGAVFGAFCHQGQICMAINRIIVHESVHDEFVKLFVAETKKIKVGDPKNPETFIGPMTNKNQVKSVENRIKETLAAGATIALEGRSENNIIHPWILTDVTNDMSAAKNEVFGPVCCVIKASSEDEIIKLTNETNYGLSSCIYTENYYKGMLLAQQIEAGMVFVNDQSINEEAHIVFGGEKDSGVGRFNWQWVVDKFTTEQRVGVQETERKYF